MMYLLFAAIATLSLSHTATASCCTPYSYQLSGTGWLGQIYHVYPQLFALDDFMVAYDIKSERGLVNMTIRDVTTGQTNVETTYIDKKEKKEYVVINNKICVEIPETGRGVGNCLPPDAKVVAKISILGQVNCSIFTFSTSSDSGSMDYLGLTAVIVSEKCVPMAAATLFRQENTTAGVASEIDGANVVLYYDAEVLKNTDILTPPKLCSKAVSLETSGISRDNLVFMQLMEGVESFDVFTILNRLTRMSSANENKSD
ncbi:uncharacterized protein LOC134191964 [Corticium candelabrum]|uniref:uncharacterized protein LOC134191964 n=1 Tax=Corticium candelabrum TaxID=121492 RepID=UPI002E26B6B5|nr:uncharacterized protein LOC134191964 [Corticium candelabrum]